MNVTFGKDSDFIALKNTEICAVICFKKSYMYIVQCTKLWS